MARRRVTRNDRPRLSADDVHEMWARLGGLSTADRVRLRPCDKELQILRAMIVRHREEAQFSLITLEHLLAEFARKARPAAGPTAELDDIF